MKNINVILSVLCYAGFAMALYALYQLPTSLVEHQIISLAQRASVQPVLDQLYAVVGIAILLGMATVTSWWINHQDSPVKPSDCTGQRYSEPLFRIRI